MPENFTNRPSRTSIPWAPIEPPKPLFYTSKNGGGKVAPLTPKEKAIRIQQRQQQTFSSRTASFGGFGGGTGNTSISMNNGFFSVPLSTDFLELPQSLREKREIFKHFYRSDPIVGQAVDLHTELPLSKVRLAAPKPTTCPKGFESVEEYGRYILKRFEIMCKRLKLFTKLLTINHELVLQGNCFVFAEDSEVEVPEEVLYSREKRVNSYVDNNGNPVEQEEEVLVPKNNREELELAYYRKHYKGWDRLVLFTADQIKLTSYNFTDKVRMDLIPSDRDKVLVEQAKQGDETAQQILQDYPEDVRGHIEQGRLIPLNTDPEQGSFCYHLAVRRGADDELGISLLERNLRTLYQKDKLRQAQASIASRAMTPRRLVSGEGLSPEQVDDLRDQVDNSLQDPDYSIVTNYEVRWEEQSSRDRLLDLNSENEMLDKYLLTGFGVTESLMSGESLYSGDRLKLEVINTRYLLLREILQEYVEDNLFKPVARRMGFVETDKWGEEVVLYPKLSFTRLPLRDSQDTYDALFNLYQKGSVPISVILEMFNLDPSSMKEELERDMFTVNDSLFNEGLRGIYSDVGSKIVEMTNVLDKLVKYLKLEKVEPPKEDDGGGGGRF